MPKRYNKYRYKKKWNKTPYYNNHNTHDYDNNPNGYQPKGGAYYSNANKYQAKGGAYYNNTGNGYRQGNTYNQDGGYNPGNTHRLFSRQSYYQTQQDTYRSFRPESQNTPGHELYDTPRQESYIPIGQQTQNTPRLESYNTIRQRTGNKLESPGHQNRGYQPRRNEVKSPEYQNRGYQHSRNTTGQKTHKNTPKGLYMVQQYLPIKSCEKAILSYAQHHYKVTCTGSKLFSFLDLAANKSTPVQNDNHRCSKFHLGGFYGTVMEIKVTKWLRKVFGWNVVAAPRMHLDGNCTFHSTADGIITSGLTVTDNAVLEIKCPATGIIPLYPRVADYLQTLSHMATMKINKAIMVYWAPGGFNVFSVNGMPKVWADYIKPAIVNRLCGDQSGKCQKDIHYVNGKPRNVLFCKIAASCKMQCRLEAVCATMKSPGWKYPVGKILRSKAKMCLVGPVVKDDLACSRLMDMTGVPPHSEPLYP